jgi:hypothetical protein
VADAVVNKVRVYVDIDVQQLDCLRRAVLRLRELNAQEKAIGRANCEQFDLEYSLGDYADVLELIVDSMT